MIHNTDLTLKYTNTRNGLGHSAALAWLMPRENSLFSLPTTVYPLGGFYLYTPCYQFDPDTNEIDGDIICYSTRLSPPSILMLIANATIYYQPKAIPYRN